MTTRRWLLTPLVAMALATGLVTAEAGATEPVLVPETLAATHTATPNDGPIATDFAVDFVGATWVGGGEHHDAAVRFRHGTTWTEWTLLGEDGAHRPGRPATGLVAGGGARTYEVRGLPTWARVVAINTTDGPLVEVGRRRVHGAGAATACRSRADWGADETIRTSARTYETPQVLTVHHTATTNGADAASTMRAIYRFHTVDQGFGDIGYQYVVDQDGVVYEGRWSGAASTSCLTADGDGSDFAHLEDGTDRAVVGAHVAQWNTGNVGVALLGTFTSTLPPASQRGALESTLATLVRRHDLDATDTEYDFTNPVDQRQIRVPVISGHLDWVATECPGGPLYDALPSIRSNVATLAATPPTTTSTTTTTTSTTTTTTSTTTSTTTAPTTTTIAPPPPAPTPPPPPPSGYWMVGADGTVHAFGDAADHGHVPVFGAVDLEPTPSGNGYWVVDGSGKVEAFGDASAVAPAPALARNERVTSLSGAGTQDSYWLFTTLGRVIPFGGAPFFGDLAGTPLNGPVLDSIPTPSGGGYYLVASDGGIFTFGDADFHGSMGNTLLNAPVQSLVPDADGDGYWLVASDGGIFTFEAPFHGSMGGTPLNRPVTGMVADGSAGYLMVAEDGGIFTFGTARFHGSLGDRPPAAAITSAASFPPRR